MTIAKGRPWGREASPSELAGAVPVPSDGAARAVLERARRSGDALPVVALAGGDLWRTVGGPVAGTGRAPMALPCDLGSVLLDGRQHWFIAHLVARRSWWRGRVVVAMNAQFLGRYDVAPRSHPNDGRLDVVDVSPDVGVGDRVKAWRRLPTGTHVTHPAFRPESTGAVQATFEPALRVWLDGELVGECRHLSLRVEPDAFTALV